MQGLPHALRALALGNRGHLLRQLGGVGIPRPFHVSIKPATQRTDAKRA